MEPAGARVRVLGEQEQVGTGHVRAVDAGVDRDVAKAGDREHERSLDQQFLALLDDRLGESGILLLARQVADAVGDGPRAVVGGEIGEVGRAALGLRDDGAGDTDHVAVPQVEDRKSVV